MPIEPQPALCPQCALPWDQTIDCPACGEPAEYPDLRDWPTAPRTIDAIRAIVTDHAARMVDGVLLDALTAHAIVATYDALSSDTVRQQFAGLSITRMASIAWKAVTVKS